MIVLTGGAGFIGSCFLKTLNDNGIDDILVVDNLGETQKWKNLVGKKFDRYENKWTFRDKLISGDYDGELKAIFHLGACSSTTESDLDYLMDNNFNYSRDLCNHAMEFGIPFHYASSAATYGAGENGYSDTDFDELKPLNGYGYSKHLFDQWLLRHGWDSKVTGYKFFNVFGPNEYHKDSMASMVFKSYHQIKEKGKVKLFRSNDEQYEDGGQKRDFIYVKDVCNIMWEFYKDDNKGIYNLGTGHARTWNDLIGSVFDAMKVKRKIEYVDMPENLSKQYQNFTEAELDKFRSVSNHKFGKLEDTVTDYVTEHLSKDWKYL